MDKTNRKILSMLSADASISAAEISAAVHLSIPAVNKRIRDMRESKTIRSFTISTDPKKVGKPVIAFIFVVFRFKENMSDFFGLIERDPVVLECYALTGEYDYMIKVCAENIESLEAKLLTIKSQSGVERSHTMLSLMEHKFKTTILPNEAEE